MRIILLVLFLTAFVHLQAQKPYFRDYSIGYRIGEGEAIGSNHFTLPPLLKRPVQF